MIRITNVKLSIDDDDMLSAASKFLKIDSEKIGGIDIVKRSIDARYNDVNFVYTLDVKTSVDEDKLISAIKNATISPTRKQWRIEKGSTHLNCRPIIIGAGPAGLFAALILSEYGYNPLIIERGRKVAEREKDIDSFFAGGKLNKDSNICFGEGGAGTFSDGKLKTRISDPRSFYVLDSLREAGAPSDILYDANPHVGTDILKIVISNIRKKIENNGGEFLFESKVDDIQINGGEIKAVSVGKDKVEAAVVVLATGHSARDTYEMLYEKGVEMAQKPFAMGVRIEHPRELIDKALYHRFAGHKKLGAASYSLNVQAGKHKAYTFCMCPGGVVVNSSSEENALCVNGMSWFKRDGANSNSAIVCQITPEMTGGNHPLAGIYFQREYEKKAFELGGGNYSVPAMRVSDFLEGRNPSDFETQPTAKQGAVPCDISSALPQQISETIKLAIPEMGKKLKGFDMGGAVLSAVESRTSSPVRILRGEDYQSVNVGGLYPAGEGAGYSGGIVSSAVDGLKAAEAIISKYCAKE